MTNVKCPDTRWAWVEIDQGALRRNTRAFKKLTKPNQKMCCVIKANAYGHGAVQSAKIMHAAGADMFAVATVDEGVELRHGGINAPILMLSEPPVTAVDTLIENEIMPSIYTPEFALAYGECAVAHNTIGKYHMAIETGMNRIGVHYSEVLEFRRAIEFHRGLECNGVFTHFATADVRDSWDWELQYKRFTEAVTAMKAEGYVCGIVHCDNTPATILHPETHLDMVRAGVGLYGMHPCELTQGKINLEPVMSVKARITRVAHPAMGEGVGYGFTYRVPRTATQICTIPIGYADGLARELSNKMEVLYHGNRLHQVGNICMDQCMFAIQSTPGHPMPEAQIGDVVTIIGCDNDACITMDDMARLRGTINYECACGFDMRLEKVYV